MFLPGESQGQMVGCRLWGHTESDTTEATQQQYNIGTEFPVVYTLSRFSHVRLFATLWTIAHKAPLSLRFSKEEY